MGCLHIYLDIPYEGVLPNVIFFLSSAHTGQCEVCKHRGDVLRACGRQLQRGTLPVEVERTRTLQKLSSKSPTPEISLVKYSSVANSKEDCYSVLRLFFS